MKKTAPVSFSPRQTSLVIALLGLGPLCQPIAGRLVNAPETLLGHLGGWIALGLVLQGIMQACGSMAALFFPSPGQSTPPLEAATASEMTTETDADGTTKTQIAAASAPVEAAGTKEES